MSRPHGTYTEWNEADRGDDNGERDSLREPFEMVYVYDPRVAPGFPAAPRFPGGLKNWEWLQSQYAAPEIDLRSLRTSRSPRLTSQTRRALRRPHLPPFSVPVAGREDVYHSPFLWYYYPRVNYGR